MTTVNQNIQQSYDRFATLKLDNELGHSMRNIFRAVPEDVIAKMGSLVNKLNPETAPQLAQASESLTARLSHVAGIAGFKMPRSLESAVAALNDFAGRVQSYVTASAADQAQLDVGVHAAFDALSYQVGKNYPA